MCESETYWDGYKCIPCYHPKYFDLVLLENKECPKNQIYDLEVAKCMECPSDVPIFDGDKCVGCP